MKDEFYVGWQSHSPAGIGRSMRAGVAFCFLLALLVGALLALAQRDSGVSAFEWRSQTQFYGVLFGQPYPHLRVLRPSQDEALPSYSSYLLVNQNKFGLRPDLIAALDGFPVSLRGSLIYRENQTMIELEPGSLAALDSSDLKQRPTDSTDLGRQTLAGEIVDSKCYFGVMNPGDLLPHRACAIRCISGGIPPVLLVRRAAGAPLYFLLVSAQGAPLNRELLGLVGEPVEVTGELERRGDLLVLWSDSSNYRRLVP